MHFPPTSPERTKHNLVSYGLPVHKYYMFVLSLS